MSKEGIPINPELIKWARERAGFTAQEASQKFRDIEKWEQGRSLPSYPQLERLADEFKLPVAVFFFPEPPKAPPIRESFRTLPDTEFDLIPRQVLYLLRKAKALQLNLDEMCQGRNPSAKLITRDLVFDDNVSIPVMAERVRDYLGVTLATQCAWPDDDIALKSWRKTLQDAGIFVFKDAFRVEEYSGFSLYDGVFPIVYVNNSCAKTRQMFTLFHELAHLIFHTSGVDTLEDRYVPSLPEHQKRIEVLCNRFAAQFLMPETAFAKAVAEAGSDPSEHTAELLAAHFHVSREFIYRNFLDRGLIKQGSYEKAALQWKQQRQKSGSGGNPYWSQISYLGREYMTIAFGQYYQNKIDGDQLSQYLNTKPKNMGVLEEYFSRGGQ